MHQDALSLRAIRCLPALLEILDGRSGAYILEVASHLRAWDGRMEPDSVGATIFEVFFSHWIQVVMRKYFGGEMAAFLAGGASGLAASLLVDDAVGWFSSGKREELVGIALCTALGWLDERLGPDMKEWNWGRLHVLTLRHVLSGRGDLGRLLDHGGSPVRGNMFTVCNTGSGANFEVRSGASYRLVADLSDVPAGLWAVDSQGESGHPGSPHYADGLDDWIGGQYRFLPLFSS